MSALGDYIHFNVMNYEKFGTARVNEGNKPYKYNHDAFLNSRTRSLPKINKTTLNILQKRLKLNTQQQVRKDEQRRQAVQQSFIDEIYKIIYQQVTNRDKIHRLLDTTAGNAVFVAKKDGTATKMQLSTTSQWASSLTHNELLQLAHQKDIEYKNLQKQISQINSGKIPVTKEIIEDLKKQFEQYTGRTISSGLSTVGAIKTALQEFRYRGTMQEVAGQFGENLLVACSDAIEDLALSEVSQFLYDHVKGEEKSEIRIPAEALAVNLPSKRIHTESMGNYYSFGKTQNKVDVSIQVNNKNLNISVKDYAAPPDHYATPKLQDVNVLQSLVFLNSFPNFEDFGNHWLNLHSLELTDSSIKEKKKSADTIFQQEIAYEALASGSPFKKVPPADTFVFIDRAKGYIYADSTINILKEQYGRFNITPQIDTLSLIEQNKQCNTWEQRIANILNKAHSLQIRVALNIQPTNLKT